ncbi:uncharacterized protein Mb2257 [Arthrobacter sp. Hiyo1]|uniref:HAD hydrolase-like protein n=1 Tax=Arthrobacter sp. Hiyo1 TaxID=1588020 RepID=UPI0006A36F03|nr:HAD hydrolase-like protein [Arthrobacter sp. Hiyo1]GAP58846.1 uncharacterized protein Mb2257 [Arthrobacter sp. Hiyo1]
MILPHHSHPTFGAITCVLFDMDGTLIDSARGVTSSAARALESVGAPVPRPDELLRFVGPPMVESFRAVSGIDEATAQRALQHYRKAYADHGAEQSSLYEGVTELLEQLRSAGIPMAVATSKVEDQALRLARRFGIESNFITICGASDVERRATKAEVIGEALLRLASLGIDISNPAMVGDRSYDVAGAAEHGISTFFALWGYGGNEEALHAAATAISPTVLLPMILATSVSERSAVWRHR